MFLVLTIYEVFENFFAWLFPADILVAYADVLQLLSFVLTLVFIFGFVLIPLWKIGTFFFRKVK